MKKKPLKKAHAGKGGTAPAARPKAKKAAAPRKSRETSRETKPPATKKTAEKSVADTSGKTAVRPVRHPVVVEGKTDDKRTELRARLREKKEFKPFTLEEAQELAKAAHKTEDGGAAPAAVSKDSTAPARRDLEELAKAQAPSHIKAASLADILGFNPKKAQKARLFADPDTIPDKYRRYYKLLLDLRRSLTDGLALHTEETLRRSTKEDAGDLSSYGQHMADAGTDTFDRDFALSMVANEQEALTEIDAAIKRIENGTYGICEITQKPIAKERLAAVPFTRYSAEAQKEIERNRMRIRTAAGLFGEIGVDASRADESGGGDEE